VTAEKNKPVLDEQTFGRLIEAAYVLQEHNREMEQMHASLELHSERLRQQEAERESALPKDSQPEQVAPSDGDYTLTLAEIVEAQNQIQIRHLEKDEAMALVAERIMRIARASGAGIAILDDKTIRYRAGAGACALPVGSEAPFSKAICTTCIRTGQVLRTPDVNTEFLFDPDLCRSRGIQSMVAVPVYHNGEIIGALELYFARQNGYSEQDIHTCQLMAGLVTEAIGRDSESSLKKSVAAERSAMLAAIEKLKPSLTAIADEASVDEVKAEAAGLQEAGLESWNSSTAHSAIPAGALTSTGPGPGVPCWKCRSPQAEDAPFCDKCGAPQLEGSDPSGPESKLASDWYSQLADPGMAGADSGALPAFDPMQFVAAQSGGASVSLESALDLPSASLFNPRPRAADESLAAEPSGSNQEATRTIGRSSPETHPVVARSGTALQPSPAHLAGPKAPEGTWSSAAKARDFLEAVSRHGSRRALDRLWNARRGQFYLAIALILVAVVVRWGIVGRSAMATGTATAISGKTVHRRTAPDEDLSTFDKLLISLGLAEAPEAPAYQGNPDIQVWVDQRTALYYCPGADLYGKTPKGKFTTQREAQLDHFESASRRTCE